MRFGVLKDRRLVVWLGGRCDGVGVLAVCKGFISLVCWLCVFYVMGGILTC